MPLIGIIAKETDSNFIKNEVIKNAQNKKFEFININKKSIENIKNIKFETVIINDNLTDFLKDSNYLETIIKKSKNLIINSDVVKNVFLNNSKNIITYGLNQKATITASSIKSDNILICVQKQFENNTGNIIEEQEININMEKNNRKKICNSMGAFAILNIYGEKLKKI